MLALRQSLSIIIFIIVNNISFYPPDSLDYIEDAPDEVCSSSRKLVPLIKPNSTLAHNFLFYVEDVKLNDSVKRLLQATF